MKSTVSADAKFLRRVFLGLVFAAVASGAMAGLTTVNAMTAQKPGNCIFFCE